MWGDSLDSVGGFFTRLSLEIVGFVPWLAVVLPLALVGYVAVKRLRRSLPGPAPALAKQPA